MNENPINIDRLEARVRRLRERRAAAAPLPSPAPRGLLQIAGAAQDRLDGFFRTERWRRLLWIAENIHGTVLTTLRLPGVLVRSDGSNAAFAPEVTESRGTVVAVVEMGPGVVRLELRPIGRWGTSRQLLVTAQGLPEALQKAAGGPRRAVALAALRRLLRAVEAGDIGDLLAQRLLTEIDEAVSASLR